MWFKFLGTSAGAPTKTRNVTGLALGVSGAKAWYLVDCGEGTQHRVMQAGLSLSQLKAICITHVHGDHCFGLPGLLASASMMGRTAPLLIVGPEPLEAWLRHAMTFSDSHCSYAVNFIAHESLKELNEFSDIKLGLVPLSHRVPCRGYVFETLPGPSKLDVEKLETLQVPKGPLWGQLRKGESVELSSGEIVTPEQVLLPPSAPIKCLIGGDNDTPACFAEAAEQADVFVHEATYTESVSERIGPAPQHSSAARVARFAEERKIPNLVLTHFSPRYRDLPAAENSTRKPDHYTVRDIYEEAAAIYGGHLFLAEDLAHFELNSQRVLERSG